MNLDNLQPKIRKYVIAKEITAVSIADAIRKERSATIFEIREVVNDEADE